MTRSAADLRHVVLAPAPPPVPIMAPSGINRMTDPRDFGNQNPLFRNVKAVPRFGTWEPPVTPSSGHAQPLQLIRNFSHEPTLVASEWMVSVIRPPPPTAVR